MKIYTIGRDPSCNISFNDDIISRRHALIKVYATGRMEIVDTSNNGTYINNVRIARNVSVPVTRKDNVSFARARQLDWTLIPDPRRLYCKIGVALLALILIVGGIVFAARSCSDTEVIDSTTTTAGGGNDNDAATKGDKAGSSAGNGGGIKESVGNDSSSKTKDEAGDAKKGADADWIKKTINQAKASQQPKNKAKKPESPAKKEEKTQPQPKVKENMPESKNREIF